MTRPVRTALTSLLAIAAAFTSGSVSAQSVAGTGLPSGFTAPGLPFNTTASVATVASPSPVMAIANPGGLSFGGSSGVPGIGSPALTSPTSGNAGGLSLGGGTAIGAGAGVASAGTLARRQFNDVTGGTGGGGGGAPAGAGISGAGPSRSPTDAYFDPLAGSGLR